MIKACLSTRLIFGHKNCLPILIIYLVELRAHDGPSFLMLPAAMDLAIFKKRGDVVCSPLLQLLLLAGTTRVASSSSRSSRRRLLLVLL